MDFEFNSKKELYDRVIPALHAKEVELKRKGYPNVKGIDIWNYLIQVKWLKGNNLMLSDIVNDIMTADCNKLNSYVNSKKNEPQENENMEVI